MIFFTSDLHLNHANILKYQPLRQGKNVDEMNNIIINNWNSVVTNRDTVYVLGDVVFGANNTHIYIYILSRLNGQKILIKGNHDSNSTNLNSYFAHVKDYYELDYDFGDIHKQKIVMCHYAFKVWNKSHYGSWNLYGHSHGTLAPVGKQLDVGIDATLNYEKMVWNRCRSQTVPSN